MRKLIVNKTHVKIKCLFGSVREYSLRYKQLKNMFAKDEMYSLFAEPLPVEGGDIQWFADIDGQIKNYEELSETEQKSAMIKLKGQIEALQKYTGQVTGNKAMLKTIEQYIEIPAKDDIYIHKKNNGQEQIILIRWGCLSDAFDSEKGLISKMIPNNIFPMVFKVVYDDNTIAAHETIFFEYGKLETKKKSNANGIIDMGEFVEGDVLKAYQKKDEERLNVQEYTNDITEEYIIKIKLERQNMIFTVYDTDGKIQPNTKILFDVNGQKEEYVSDINGTFRKNEVRVGTEIKAYQIIENQETNFNTIVCEKDKENYKITIKLPEPNVMKFKVLDNKDELVPNAELKVTYAGKTVTIRSDENGIAELIGIENNTEVTVVATAKKQKKSKK